MYQLKIKKRAYALRATKKAGHKITSIHQLGKCTSHSVSRTEYNALAAGKKSTCKTPFTTWPVGTVTLTPGREHSISHSSSTFVSSRPSAGNVTTGSRSIPRKLLRAGGPSGGRVLFHPHFRVKTNVISSKKPTRRSHQLLSKSGESDNVSWATLLDKCISGCDPVDEKKIINIIPGIYFSCINNGPNPVELKLPDGHSFTMPPNMSMMIPRPIEKTFYTHEDYHYGMKRRYVFPFAGQWWHMREQGESVSDQVPIKFDFKSYSFKGNVSNAINDEVGLVDTGHRKPNYELFNPLDLYERDFLSKIKQKPSYISMWLENIRYYMRESKFKINRRPSSFTGMYDEDDHVDQDIQEAAKNALFGCPFCGISDGPGNCTERANCLNVSMAAEEKMKQRDASYPGCNVYKARVVHDEKGNVEVIPDENGDFTIYESPQPVIAKGVDMFDHGAYPAPGDKEFNEQRSTLQAEDDIEQARRESTVAGFRGYKDPKYKPKKR
jgi:hypothetical protein